ncbi:MAG: NADH-quinone oxidoreductase subunit NuoE [Candidatus Aminicenantes bacterium]|nr:NADH-quinone oxidoreductase subunit NuoE [Candidatus Aminicenantes bacterium]
MSREFTADLKKRIEEITARYPSRQAALLPVLHLVQGETGFLSAEEERAVASILGLPPIKVREVVTFYTMFTRKPLGRFHLQVCSNLSCSLAAGERILRHLQAKLGIGVGETTPDGKYTLTEVECLGACEQAPCMMVNFDYHGNLDPEKVERIMEELK